VKSKPVFETIDTILGHGFAGFTAETLSRPLVYWMQVEKSQEKCFVYGLV